MLRHLFSSALVLALGAGLSAGEALAQQAEPAAPRSETAPAQTSEGAQPSGAAEADAPSAGAAPGAQAPAAPGARVQPEEDQLRGTHGDWERRCARPGGAEEVCYLSQVLNNDEGSPLLRAVLRKVDTDQAEAVLTVQAPLGVVLPRGLSMSIDGGEAQAAPFLYCIGNGCYAQIAVAEEGLQRLRRGSGAEMTIYSVQQPETPVETRLSLIGFTAGYDALN